MLCMSEKIVVMCSVCRSTFDSSLTKVQKSKFDWRNAFCILNFVLFGYHAVNILQTKSWYLIDYFQLDWQHALAKESNQVTVEFA